MAARIFLDEKLKERFFQREELFIQFIPMLIRTSRYGEIIDTVCEVIDSNDDNTLEIITTTFAIGVMDSDNQDKCKKLQKLLEKCLEKYIALGETSLIGGSHYNLGNHYRSRRLYRKGINHYLLARKFDRKYLNQSYYYQELAGTLFEYGKNLFSAKLYKLALEKGAPESIKPLYADALMLSGSYKLAHDVFSEYLDSVECNHAEWHLKNICLKNIIDTTGIQEQVRKKKEALNIIDISKVDDPSFSHNLEMAIEQDVLCGLAWFNLGILNSKLNNHHEAAFSFILCGLIQTGDIEAWVNATLCCLNPEIDIQILPLVLNTGYFFNGDEYISMLHKELEIRLDGEMLENIINVIEEMLPNSRNKEPQVVRLMNEDGVFRDVLNKNV
jgi:tetratricopeptide (TPR) repeat protein